MRRGKPSHVLTTLVFTDIVGSTQVAEELGDRRWRELLARHHRIVREALREHGGLELDTAGDGVFARFDSPASAIRFAADASDALRELGIEIRSGVHIGNVEVFDGKLSGVNVHVAARTMATAGPNEILVTGSVRDLVRGGGFGFADRGTHELRGIEGEWPLFEVTSVDDTPRAPALPDEEARARRSQIVPPTLVKRRGVRLTVVAAAIVLGLVAAIFAVAFAVGGASAAPLTGCEVTGNPPLNDRAFNQAVYDGLTDASTKWGIGVHAKVSENRRQWFHNVRDFVAERCSLIVTLGTITGADTAAVAKANPGARFASTDAANVQGTPNLVSIRFKSDEAAFLAGYLAAGVTKTGKIGTFGGIPIATVTLFMEGFWAGAQYYNRVHGTHVRVLGWNPKTQHGQFASDDPNNFSVFVSDELAAGLTSNLIRSGADVVFPVDGPSGETGSCDVAQHHKGVLLVGVDADQHYATPDCEAQWVTSVLKIYRRMVFLAMEQVVDGRFKGGVLEGTLANGGVGLAPFYGLTSKIPRSLLRELDLVQKRVANGSVPVDPQTYLAG